MASRTRYSSWKAAISVTLLLAALLNCAMHARGHANDVATCTYNDPAISSSSHGPPTSGALQTLEQLCKFTSRGLRSATRHLAGNGGWTITVPSSYTPCGPAITIGIRCARKLQSRETAAKFANSKWFFGALLCTVARRHSPDSCSTLRRRVAPKLAASRQTATLKCALFDA